MPDGKRKRRFSKNAARRAFYAKHRAIRFRKRFGIGEPQPPASWDRRSA